VDASLIPVLQDAIRHLHGTESVFVAWVRACGEDEEDLVWERQVGVFRLLGHPRATRAYAWAEPGTSSRAACHFFAVLEIPPIDSPVAAVRASIAADAQKR
jgi:hypothetical protein